MRLIAAFVLLTTCAAAQVTNNDISSSSKLEPGVVIHSTTARNSVEWACVNKALTNKCLVYHNDQWFTFQPDRNGKFYLNISSQKCRDEMNGIQLVVIEGNPCQTKTYKLIHCLSQIRREDVFIELDSMKKDVTYLVNIDGFLGDYCEFDIWVDIKPNGLPTRTKNLDTLDVTVYGGKKHVQILWKVDERLAKQLSHFKVFRAEKSKKMNPLRDVGIGANAYGVMNLNYQLRDTLPKPGVYTYFIFGQREEDDIPILLSVQDVPYHEEKAKQVEESKPKIAQIPLPFRPGELFSIMVFDETGSTLIWKTKQLFDPAKHSMFAVTFDEWVAAGTQRFMVIVLDSGEKTKGEYYFTLDKSGRIVSY